MCSQSSSVSKQRDDDDDVSRLQWRPLLSPHKQGRRGSGASLTLLRGKKWAEPAKDMSWSGGGEEGHTPQRSHANNIEETARPSLAAQTVTKTAKMARKQHAERVRRRRIVASEGVGKNYSPNTL